MIDEEKLKTTMIANTRAQNKAKKVRDKQKELAETAAVRDTIQKQRRENRIRFSKWEQEVDRGYNPVFTTLIDLTNPVDAQKTMPMPKRPQTVWDQVQQRIDDKISRAATASGPKDLSDGNGATAAVSIPGSPISSSRVVSSRVVTARPSASRLLDSSQPSTSRARLVKDHSVPKLDMTYVEPPSPVAYSDTGGPPGAPIAMIRTGGFSGLKKE